MKQLKHRFPSWRQISAIIAILLSLTGSAKAGLHVEQVQRDFQTRHKLITGAYLPWPQCAKGQTPAPQFPKDGFYGDLIEDPDEGVRVVRDLVQKFYSDNVIYTYFIKASNGYEDVDNAPTVVNYAETDMNVVSVSEVTTNNYMEKLQLVFYEVNKLSLIKVTADQVITLTDSKQTFARGEDASCAASQSCASSEHPSTAWGYSSIFLEGCELIDVGSSAFEEVFSNIRVQFWTAASVGRFDAGAFNTRGKISADLTQYPNGVVRTYLKLTTIPVGGGDTTTFAQARPTSADEGHYGYWSQGALALGTVATSGYVTYSDSNPTELGTCGTVEDKVYGWWVVDAIAVVQPDFTSTPDPQECCPCSTCEPGTITASLQSIHVDVPLGGDNFGGSAGSLTLTADLPSTSLAKPAGLRYAAAGTVEIITNSVQTQLQLKTSQSLFSVKTNSNYAYTISVYVLADAGTKDGTGFYQPTGTAYTTVLVENPDSASSSNRLHLTRSTEGNSTLIEYTYTAGQWEMVTGNGLRKETKGFGWDAAHANRTETNTVRNASDQVVFKEINVYTFFAWGQERTTNIFNPDGVRLTNTWSYYAGTNDGGAYGKLKEEVNGYGHWTRYEYDQFGRETNRVKQFLNSAVGSSANSNRAITTTYSTNVPQITIVESLLGNEVARRYRVTASGELTDIQCQTAGAAWTAGDNLVTVTKKYTNGSFAGELRRVSNPDGTVQAYLYATNATEKTTVILSGEPDPGSETNILQGTITTTVSGLGGETRSKTVWYRMPGPSSFLTGQDTYTYLDARNRSYRVVHLDGTTNQYNYACCGLESEIDRDGTVSSYVYDGLKRQIGLVRNGITVTNLLNALGAALTTVRVATNGNTITMQANAYDTAGQLTSATDALSNATFYTNYLDGTGQLIRQATLPNNSTRIETYFKDGSLKQISGTAIHGIRYDYGYTNNGRFALETKLQVGGSDSSESVLRLTDMLSRSYEDRFSDGAFSRTFYNAIGRLSKQVDPDGVITLFTYDSLGQVEYTAIDMDRSGTIGLAGTDRITQTVTDVSTNSTYGTTVRRTRTYIWPSSSSASQLLTTSETSVNGLSSWTTLWNGGVAVVSSRRSAYSGSHRYVTNTAPDGTYTLSDFQNGRLGSEVRKDVAGSQTASTTFTYDAHGRLATSTDARNGTTTFGYDNADRQTSITTPVPATGQAAQVTTTAYNNMGWVTSIALPDSTVVSSSYLLTGELATNSGSRTYPVAYAYDYAGRLKTLTTWTNFAARQGATTTTWNYDAFRGFLTNKSYANGLGPTFAYTPAGRLKTRTWARGVVTTYETNSAGDIAKVFYSDGTPGTTNTFDRLGRLITVNTLGNPGENFVDFLYNDAGLVLRERRNTFYVVNTYDSAMRRVTNSATALGPDMLLVQHTNSYDAASRLGIVSDGTRSAAYTYHANSPLVNTITFTEGATTRLTTTKSWDYLNRLTQIDSAPAADDTLSFAYAYNTANQRTAVTNADSSYWLYAYDPLGQITSGKRYWSDGTVVAGQQFEYGFDDIGNRRWAAAGGNEWGSDLRYENYTVNNLNEYNQRTVPGRVDIMGAATNDAIISVNNQQAYRKSDYYRKELIVDNSAVPVYQSITNVGVLNNGTNADTVTNITGSLLLPNAVKLFTYDLDGNLTSDGIWTNIWDAENRLVLSSNLTTVPAAARMRQDWSYLPDGRWAERTVYTWDGANYVAQSTNRFVWDGNVLLAIIDHTNGLITSFMRGSDLSGSPQGAGGAGGLVATTMTGGGNHFAAFDGNGNVVGLVNAADGKLSAIYEYGAFGAGLRETGSVAKKNPLRFGAQYRDDIGGGYKYVHRDLQTDEGRWKSRDPLGEHEGLNLFAFARNDAVNRVDALGLYILTFKGDDWTANQIDKVVGAFLDLRAGLPNALRAVDEGVKKAADLPDACEYKKELLVGLGRIKANLSKIGNGLITQQNIDLYLYSKPSEQNAAKVPSKWLKYPNHIWFNEGAVSTFNFFKFDPATAAATILHEVSHFSAGTDTTDEASGTDYWNNGPFYESVYKNSLKIWGYILRKEIISKTGDKCCPKVPWPNN